MDTITKEKTMLSEKIKSPVQTINSLYNCRSISELQQIINQYITNLEQLAQSTIVQ